MRKCGMLLPVSSLPSRYGIGAFSKEAYEFVDILKEAGQRWWQILPLGPTGYGDSPYQSFSAFAGNPFFIDLETLVEEGLLTEKECQEADFGQDPRVVWYDHIYEERFPLLRKAYERFKTGMAAGSPQAQTEAVHRLAESELLDETREYCFYMAVKNAFGGKSWDLWEDDIRLRKPDALTRCRTELSDEIGFYEFQQLQFQKQWEKLKAYANKQGVGIFGDIPIYVAFDSADSWAHPELFQFDTDRKPIQVAGCPPDAYAATGQLWGNPLYDWEYHRDTGYEWWLKRMRYSFRLYDQVRVDHFRGFDQYYAVPYGDKTAEFGHWEDGPGLDIFRKMKETFGEALPIVAEDLGFLTPTVYKLLADTGFPGMKVLEFAFSPDGESIYLPYHYETNCVVYTGTHDNDTLQGWYESISEAEQDFVREYVGIEKEQKDIHWELIRLALASRADLAMIPVQDYLGLGHEARMNEPSTVGGNWNWRLLPGEIGEELIKTCRRMAWIYGRCR